VSAREESPAERSPGRRQRTTRREIEQAALALFLTKGYDETTVEDIAEATSIGRRTFFRYFASKNDVAWGEFDKELARLRTELDATPTRLPLLEAIKVAVVRANRYSAEDLPSLRQRLSLLVGVPALRAHAMHRYVAWETVVAEFVGRRLGVPAASLVPQAVARACLGVALAAYTAWVEDEHADLEHCLEVALGGLAHGFSSSPAPQSLSAGPRHESDS
jgi:mycofactocin system transcriptional regulator